MHAYTIPSGSAYGVVLNDLTQLEALSDAFSAAPYKAAPKAPVLYIKPRSCFAVGGAPVPLPADLQAVQAAATVGLLFARDLCRGQLEEVAGAIGAACLALDVSEPCDSYYRPPIRQLCRDGFLPLGAFAPLPARLGDIVTSVDGREVHRWSVDRLARPMFALAAEISAFMTLRAGDLLLVGLPGDAPRARARQTVTVACQGLPSLTSTITPEAAP